MIVCWPTELRFALVVPGSAWPVVREGRGWFWCRCGAGIGRDDKDPQLTIWLVLFLFPFRLGFRDKLLAVAPGTLHDICLPNVSHAHLDQVYSWRFASTAAHTAGFWMHKFLLEVIQEICEKVDVVWCEKLQRLWWSSQLGDSNVHLEATAVLLGLRDLWGKLTTCHPGAKFGHFGWCWS